MAVFSYILEIEYKNKLPRKAYKPTLNIDLTDNWELVYGRAQPQLVKTLILNLNFCFKTYCQISLLNLELKNFTANWNFRFNFNIKL